MKVKFSEKYEVDQVNRTVTCTVTIKNIEEVKNLFNTIENAIIAYNHETLNGDVFIKSHLYFNDTFVATAKCHPNDTFNENYGKHLARNRAYEKATRFTKKVEDVIRHEACTLFQIFRITNNFEVKVGKEVSQFADRLLMEMKSFTHPPKIDE